MTAAHDYQDLHNLVDRLTPTQARHLRLLISEDKDLPEPLQEQDTVPEGLLALIGSSEGPEDLSINDDCYIQKRLTLL